MKKIIENKLKKDLYFSCNSV